MAKLKGPLMSLGASGAIGKAIVYFGWKGLDVVREYVIPSNPKTSGQTTQRGYLADAVDDIHAAQAIAVKPLVEDDVMAYSLLGSTRPTPRTWFNEAVKQWIDQKVAAKSGTTFRSGYVTPAVASLVVGVYSDEVNALKIATGQFKYGTSKTALIHTMAATPGFGTFTMFATIAGLTAGVKYYVQFETLTVAGYVGCKSGIYYGTPT